MAVPLFVPMSPPTSLLLPKTEPCEVELMISPEFCPQKPPTQPVPVTFPIAVEFHISPLAPLEKANPPTWFPPVTLPEAEQLMIFPLFSEMNPAKPGLVTPLTSPDAHESLMMPVPVLYPAKPPDRLPAMTKKISPVEVQLCAVPPIFAPTTPPP